MGPHPTDVNPEAHHGGRPGRIVLTTVGSLGDLHPYLALGVELQRRGHIVTVATTALFGQRVEAAGLRFHPLRATATEGPSPEVIRRVFNGSRGVEYIFRELILPALGDAYRDTCDVAAEADLLVAHPLAFATRIVAEGRGLPWISTQLAPVSLLSALDPPFLPGLAWLHRLGAPPAVWRALLRFARWQTRRWLQPVDALRRGLGLPEGGNALFDSGGASTRELALFSPLLGAPQADWSPNTVATGFAFYDQPAPGNMELEAFLNAGAPPIVFTLGSSAVITPGDFFRESALAARQVNRRALLLGAASESAGTSTVPGAPGQDVFACAYASYAEVFPRAAAVVHQGGVGTTAEALRAGRPMLVVPFGADQPDNARRVERLGVARVLSRRRYRAMRVAQELRRLLEPGYARRAEQLGALVRAEAGVRTACDEIEDVLNRREPKGAG